MTQEQLNKLPKWAQKHIKDCERIRSEAETKLEDYLDQQSESLVYTKNGLNEKRFIQDDTVYFVLGDRKIISVRIDGNSIRLHGDYFSSELVIVPECSNVVSLKINDR